VIPFSQVVPELHDMIDDILFMIQYREKPTYFTRSTGKITFLQLICFVLGLPKASIQAEVNHFLKTFVSPAETMTKSSLTEARLKVSFTAFSAINDFIMEKVYKRGDDKRYKGYRLISMDGSIFDVNAGAEKTFGSLKTSGNSVAKAQVVALVDVLNDLTLEALVGAYAESERDMALEAVTCLQGKSDAKDLYVGDRGFPSREMIFALMDTNSTFLMRVSSNFIKAVNEAKKPDQVVQIFDAEKKKHNLRVVNITLSTGETEKLITNEFYLTIEDLREIYHLRWGIERKYLELKERLQIENFTGSLPELILQDFYATIVVSNLVSLAKQEAQYLNDKKPSAKKRKYEYKINTNLTIAALRDTLIYALLEENPRKARRTVSASLMTIRKSLIPIRSERKSSPRIPKNPSQKFPLNKKIGW